MNAILIGKGGWGELLKLYIQKNTHFNLVGVYGSDFDISQIPPYTQVAFIATPLYSHFDLALMCIKKGLHVFVEKPTCKTLEQFHILQDHAHKHGSNRYFLHDVLSFSKRNLSHMLTLWGGKGKFFFFMILFLNVRQSRRPKTAFLPAPDTTFLHSFLFP